MRVICIFAAAAFVIQTIPVKTFAEEPDEEMKVIFEMAEDHFNKGDYLKASQLYREVLKKNKAYWRMYFNIGRCETALKRTDLAVEAFAAYLEGGGDRITQDRRDMAEEAVSKYKPELASLAFSETDPMDIFIDETPRGTTPTVRPVYVMPGEHRVELKRGDESIFEKTIVIAAGEEAAIERPKPESKPEPAPPKRKPEPSDKATAPEPLKRPPIAVQTAEPVKHKRSPLKPVGYTLLAVGGALIIPGTITGIMYVSQNNYLEGSCPTGKNCSYEDLNTRETVDSLAVITNVMLPIGGVIATTGIILTVVGHRKSKKENKLGFVPYINDNVTGIVISGRF